MSTVTFEKAQRWYAGTDAPAVAGLDLEIEDREFMVLVGPSGCGKSTTARMLRALEEEGLVGVGPGAGEGLGDFLGPLDRPRADAVRLGHAGEVGVPRGSQPRPAPAVACRGILRSGIERSRERS